MDSFYWGLGGLTNSASLYASSKANACLWGLKLCAQMLDCAKSRWGCQAGDKCQGECGQGYCSCEL